MNRFEQKFEEDDQQCPLCGQLTPFNGKYPGIYQCNFRHGKFEWFDRNVLKGMDSSMIFNSLSYSAKLKSNYNKMRIKYLRGFKNRVLRYFSTTKDVSFLDVGCANGEYLNCAVDLGMKSVMGVEIDQTAASNAVNVAPVVSDISEVDTSFDVIQCKNVIGNIYLFEHLIKRLLNMLTPRGILFLDVLNNYGTTAFFKRLRGKPGMLKPPYIINGFSKESMMWLAKKNNAEVINMNTAYCGSDMVPYQWKMRLFIVGQIAVAIKAGVMILLDVKTK